MPGASRERLSPLKRTVRVGKFLEEGAPGILLAASVLLLCADVAARYVFNSPVPGAGAIAMVCFVWVTFIGSAAIARRGRHIVIDVLVARLPARLQAIIQVFVQVLVLAVISYVLYYAWDALLNTRFVAIPGLGVSRRIVVVALFIGFLLMTLYALRDLVLAVQGVITGEYEAAHDSNDDDYESLEANAPVHGGYEPPTDVTEAVFIKELDEVLEPDNDTLKPSLDDGEENRS